MNDDIRIRLGRDADKPQVLAGLEAIFGATAARRAERLWDWQWRDDPRLPVPGYRAVVAERGGHLLGNVTTIPAGLYLAGAPADAWWLVDGFVIPEARGRGLANALIDHPATGPIRLSKHVSEPMRRVCAGAGFRDLPGTGSLHRRLSTRYRLGRFLGTRLGDLTGSLLDLTLGRLPPPALPVQIHPGPFDPRFDALWQSVRGAYPAICRRDAALLNWRYHQHPEADCVALTLEGRDGLRGYCVVRAFERPGRPRRRRGMLLDLLAAPSDTPAREALLAAGLRELQRQRAERVTCFQGGADQRHLLRQLGFKPLGNKARPVQPMIARGLPETASGCYVTLGDGDGG